MQAAAGQTAQSGGCKPPEPRPIPRAVHAAARAARGGRRGSIAGRPGLEDEVEQRYVEAAARNVVAHEEVKLAVLELLQDALLHRPRL
eukprot:2659381-Prymnesium_polylepis.2